METSFVAAAASATVALPPTSVPNPREDPRSGSVLRLAILIADAKGEILYWNAEAERALARLAKSDQIVGLRDVFSAEVLDRLQDSGAWVVVEAAGDADVTFRVRLRRIFDRSMFLFFADSRSRAAVAHSS